MDGWKLLAGPLVALLLVPSTASLTSSDAEAASKQSYRKALRECRSIFGKTVYKVTLHPSGLFHCHRGIKNPKTATEKEARAACRELGRGSASVQLVRRKGRWMCLFRN